MRAHFACLLFFSWSCGPGFDFPTTGVLGKGKFAYLCANQQDSGIVSFDHDDPACDGTDDVSIEIPATVAKGSTFEIAVMADNGGTGTLVSSNMAVIEPAFGYTLGYPFYWGNHLAARGSGMARLSSSGKSADFIEITVVDIADLSPPSSLTLAVGIDWPITLTAKDSSKNVLAGNLYCDWDTLDPTIAIADGTTRNGHARGLRVGTTAITATCGGVRTEIPVTIIVQKPPPPPDAGTDASDASDASSDATDASDSG